MQPKLEQGSGQSACMRSKAMQLWLLGRDHPTVAIRYGLTSVGIHSSLNFLIMTTVPVWEAKPASPFASLHDPGT